MEKIENSFRDLMASLQIAKLYTTKHPMFRKSLEKAYLDLEEILKEREELVIGIIGEELAFEKEILFDLSKMTRPAIIYLKDRGIEKLAFYRGLKEEELGKFIAFLASSAEEVKSNPQEYLSEMGIKNIAVGRIKGDSSSLMDKEKKSSDSLNIYESSLDKVSQTLTNVLDTKSIDHLTLRFAINNVVENLTTRYQEFLKLTTVKRYDLETYVHLLNVSILAMYFSSKVGFSKDDVMDIGISALFHDIGKLYISRKTLGKAERLTDEEFTQIKSHTVLGAEILLGYVDTLGILPVVVSFEHHLKYDLTGYPKLSYRQKLHIASLIVSICDVYDALYQRRGYKMDYSPDMIYNLMIREKGTAFEPILLDKFFKIMGVWPIGSIVALSNGSVAVIRDENEDDIFSPKVEVIYPEDKRESVDLREKKGSIKIERFLNPWKEGRDYLHLV